MYFDNDTISGAARAAIHACLTSDPALTQSDEQQEQMTQRSLVPVALALDAIQLAHHAGADVEAILQHVLRDHLARWKQARK